MSKVCDHRTLPDDVISWGSMDCEIRFIIGEVNFNDLERGLWLPMCLMIFGTVKKGQFSYIDYKAIRKSP